MRARSLLAATLRSLAFAILLSVAAVGAPSRAVAQDSSSQFKTELSRVQADMRALRAEAAQFRILASYCKPPRLPDKERDEQTLADLSRRADEINRRYQQLKANLRRFLQHSPRAAAELMISDVDPQSDRWWRSYEADRARMFEELNRKKAALAAAPVRDCAPPRPQATPQVAPPPAAPSLPQAPSYPQLTFPTVPTHFCSQEDYWRFINDVINPQFLRAAENAEAAARFRSQAEQAVNAHVQAGRPVPADLRALRARAQREYAEAQRLSDEMARLRGRAGRTPVIDCSKTEPSHSSVIAPPSRYGLSSPNSVNARIYQAYSEFMDARQRCDLAVMNRKIAELEELAREAKKAFSDIAMGMQGPFDQEPTPENLEFWAAEADKNAAERLLTRARGERARCPCNLISAPVQELAPPVLAAPPGRSLQDAQRSVAKWVEETDGLFGELAQAVQARDCARIADLVLRLKARFDRSGKLWWSVVPPQFLAKWRFVFLKARETCRPQRDEPESILDSIDEVPVIALAPTAPPDAVSAALLAYHNRLRDEVGSVALRWNSALAANASVQARVIADSGQLQHASREGRQRTERENLSISIHRANSPMTMVQTWGAERSLYRPGTFPNVCAGDWSQCAHYTQMVWSTTTDVGCAFVEGRRFDALVCRYSPPGNRDGRAVTGIPPVQSVNPCPPALGALSGRGTRNLEGR